MEGATARRALLAAVPVAAIVCATAALAAAAWLDRPPIRLIWLVFALVGSRIAAHVAQHLRSGEANLLLFIAAGWMIGTLTATTALLASWGIATLTGSGAAPVLLMATALALFGGALVQLVLRTIASLLSAIRGPSRSPPAGG